MKKFAAPIIAAMAITIAMPAAAGTIWDTIKNAGTGLGAVTRTFKSLSVGGPILPFIIVPKGSSPYMPGSGQITHS